MKKSFLFALVASVLFVGSVSHAMENPMWEITGGLGSLGAASNTTGTVGSLGIGKNDNAVSSSSNFNVTGGVGYFFMPALEAMFNANMNFGHVGGGSSYLNYGLLVGPGFNFLGDIADAFVITPQIGITKASTDGVGGMGMQFAVTLSKRFKLCDHVSYMPGVSFVRSFPYDVKNNGTTIGTKTGNSNFAFTPLQFSIWF